jgi:glycosyltransferase involved in cell wall biosynthesis
VLIEAMAASTVVVASALDGYRNVATDDVDSVLVAPGDAAALAAALRRVIDDDALAARLRAAGRARCEQFSMRVLAERYVTIYRELVEDARERERSPRRRWWRRRIGGASPRTTAATRTLTP